MPSPESGSAIAKGPVPPLGRKVVSEARCAEEETTPGEEEDGGATDSGRAYLNPDPASPQ